MTIWQADFFVKQNTPIYSGWHGGGGGGAGSDAPIIFNLPF